MNQRIVLLGALLLCSSVAASQSLTKTGTTAAPFLKIGVGSRAIGMGGAFTATANDISAMYWNPAGLAAINGNEATFNHVSWLADVRYDFAAAAISLVDFGTLGVFVDILTMDEMDVRTIEMPEGTGERFTAGGMAIGLSYARNLTDQFSIGFNTKYIRENLWHMSSTSFGVDVGVLYKIAILNEFRLGANIANFGPKMKLEGRDNLYVIQVGGPEGNLVNSDIQLESYDLPLLFRVGVAADVLKEETARLTLALDAVHPNDNTSYLNTGMEFGWNEILFVRGGWKSLFERDTEQRWTLGAGINYTMLQGVSLKVDYAYQDFGRLASVHYFSVGLKF
jgi:opacity protein-like surface antigen